MRVTSSGASDIQPSVAPLLEILDAVELGLRAGLRRVTGLRVADEVLGDARVLLLVDRGLRDLRIPDAHDLLQTAVARGAVEVLAALLLDLRAAGIRVASLPTSSTAARRERQRDPEA